MVVSAVVGEDEVALRTQRAVDNTRHLSASDYYVDIRIHRTLVASGKNDAGIVVAHPFFRLALDVSFRVVGVVPFAVDVHLDGTLYRQVWRAHHTIVVHLRRSLTSAHADCRIESRFDRNAETLLAMRHRLLESLDFLFACQRIETAVVVEAAEDVEGGGHRAVDSSVVWGVLPETGHLYALAHLQAVVLAVDNLVEIAAVVCHRVVVEGDILESGVAPDRQTLLGTRNLDSALVVCAIPVARDGGVAEKRRFTLHLRPLVKLQHAFTPVV